MERKRTSCMGTCRRSWKLIKASAAGGRLQKQLVCAGGGKDQRRKKKKKKRKRNRPTSLAAGPSSAGLVAAWAIGLLLLWVVGLQKRLGLGLNLGF